jgi:hypothetical protein
MLGNKIITCLYERFLLPYYMQKEILFIVILCIKRRVPAGGAPRRRVPPSAATLINCYKSYCCIL